MFDDHTSDQTHNTDNDDTGASAVPAMGLGMNPNPTYVPPSDSAAPSVIMPTVDPAGPPPSPSDTPTDGGVPPPPSQPTPQVTPPAGGAPSGLEDIKRQALDQLSPLVHKLEQTPEEKYKTIMMMIQASDNQDLITEAYETAQQITDEKVKAEALLNIVNEINYFAQKTAS